MVLKVIQDYSKKTDGKCGLSLPKLKEITSLEVSLLKTELNKLVKEKKIKYRQGINHLLFFSNE